MKVYFKKTNRVYGDLKRIILTKQTPFKVSDINHEHESTRSYLNQLVRKGKLKIEYRNKNEMTIYANNKER